MTMPSPGSAPFPDDTDDDSGALDLDDIQAFATGANTPNTMGPGGGDRD